MACFRRGGLWVSAAGCWKEIRKCQVVPHEIYFRKVPHGAREISASCPKIFSLSLTPQRLLWKRFREDMGSRNCGERLFVGHCGPMQESFPRLKTSFQMNTTTVQPNDLNLSSHGAALRHTVVSLIMDANIVVLGTESVGKSALTVRLLTRRFIGEYGDIESIYSHSFGREITLHIWDSPYSEDSSAVTSLFEKKLQWADGFVLVYSICDRASFNSVSKLIHTIKSTKHCLNADKVPIVIVGNKRDLHHRRTVLSEEGRLLALNSDCHFYEVSAAENYHSVLVVFHGLVDRMKDAKLTTKRPLGFRGIVKSMSAVFARRRTDSF